MAKWTSTLLEVSHEVGRESPLGKALVFLVENGTTEYQGSDAGVNREALEELLPQFTLVNLALVGALVDEFCEIERDEVQVRIPVNVTAHSG
ncbi:MAG: hypothetical protein Q7S69_06990 [Nitrosomonadaceae bacterium]|nr:hypothetical protein [Nitrosomonadaceae bacterium]